MNYQHGENGILSSKKYYFGSDQDIDKFSATLEKYLRDLHRQAYLAPFKRLIRKIPGAVTLYRWVQSK